MNLKTTIGKMVIIRLILINQEGHEIKLTGYNFDTTNNQLFFEGMGVHGEIVTSEAVLNVYHSTP